MGNKALDINPPTGTFHISTNASDWLWAAFSIFGASLLVIIVLDLLRPRGTRLFHQIAILILTTYVIGYFTMASDLGYAPVPVEFRTHGDTAPTRQIFYARYIQWFITFPLLVLELLLATGLNVSDIVTALFMSDVVVVASLAGTVVHSDYKWGYYTIAVVALFYVWYALLWHGLRTEFPDGGVLRSGYIQSASFLSFVLITYPICWACSEGGNVITSSSEMIWYGILDVFAGSFFLFFLLWQLHRVDYASFGFQSLKYTQTSLETSRPIKEKPAQETV